MKCFTLLLVLFLFSPRLEAQQLQTDLGLKYLVRLPKSKVTSTTRTIILLHGYGSNEQDLFGLKDGLPADYLIISARAPQEISSGSYQWYSLTVNNGKREGNMAELKESQRKLSRFVEQVITKYGSGKNEVYLCGFSQGAIMSYGALLGNSIRLKGVCALSGKIHEEMQQQYRPNGQQSRTRVFVAHGSNDQVIAAEEGKAAAEYLRRLGYKPDVHIYRDLAHSISAAELLDLKQWLERR